MNRDLSLLSKRQTIAALLAGACALISVPAFSKMVLLGTPPVAIEVRAEPIVAFDPHDPTRRRFGLLEFRGGLVLKSPYPEFGGITAIRVAPDGAQFIALSDHGRWFKGRITYDGTRPSGIADAMMAPMLGPDGQALAAHWRHAPESIAEDGGTLYVGIEAVNQIVRFDYGAAGLLARGHPIAVPPGIRTLPPSQGLEALAFVPEGQPLAGTLIAISKRLDKAGNLLAFLIGGPSPGIFSIKRSETLEITDAALLPSGDLLILECSFGWPEGVLARIRRIPLSAIRPNALVDGPVLIEADLGEEIDYMDGLSVHRATDGQIVLTLNSNDNFSPVQRTLLLQFTLADP